MIWTGARNPKGYGHKTVRGRTVYVHREALERKLGRALGPGEQARHTCDNPPCYNPDHLVPGTSTQNHLDMLQRDRCTTRRLTADEVREIRASTLRQVDLAAKYRVAQTTISAVLTRKTWPHI